MPELEAPAVPETPAAAAEPAKSSWAVGEGSDPNPVGPDPEKQAERFTKFRKNLNRELADRAERKRESPFGPRRDPLAEPEPEEPLGMSPEQYLEWRKTGQVPEAAQAEGESERAGERETAEGLSEAGLLEAAMAHGEKVHAEVKTLLDTYREHPAALQAIQGELDLVKGDPDFADIVEKIKTPFFGGEGASQRTMLMEDALAHLPCNNPDETMIEIYRHPTLQQQLQTAPAEQIRAEIATASKIAEAHANYPDFDRVAAPAGRYIAGQAHPAVMEALGRSPYVHHLLYVVGQNPAETRAFAQLAKQDPIGAIHKVAIYDQLIKAELEKSGGRKRMPEGAMRTAPPLRKPAKTITSAPPPPTEIGGKMQKAADPMEQALKDGDVQRYRKLLVKEMAQSRR